MINANDESMSTASALIASLFDAIKHGDEKHRAWLRGAIDSHFRVCRCGHPEFEHGGPQMDCGHELDGDFCGCVHFALAAAPALQPATPKLSTNEALIRELRFDSPDLDTTLAILRGVDAFLSRQPAALQPAPVARHEPTPGVLVLQRRRARRRLE